MNKHHFYIIFITFALVTFGINKLTASYETYISEYSYRVKEIERRVQLIDTYFETAEERIRQIKAFRRNLPLKSQLPELAKDIVSQADYYGVKVSDITYEPFEKVVDDVFVLKISFPVSGDYKNVRQFIYRMETIRKVINIEGISSMKSLGKESDVNIRLTFAAYFEEG